MTLVCGRAAGADVHSQSTMCTWPSVSLDQNSKILWLFVVLYILGKWLLKQSLIQKYPSLKFYLFKLQFDPIKGEISKSILIQLMQILPWVKMGHFCTTSFAREKKLHHQDISYIDPIPCSVAINHLTSFFSSGNSIWIVVRLCRFVCNSITIRYLSSVLDFILYFWYFVIKY